MIDQQEHILRNEIWLSDMSMFAEMNEVYDKWVVPGKTPARACGESKLARPQLFVEFIVTAAVPGPQE